MNLETVFNGLFSLILFLLILQAFFGSISVEKVEVSTVLKKGSLALIYLTGGVFSLIGLKKIRVNNRAGWLAMFLAGPIILGVIEIKLTRESFAEVSEVNNNSLANYCLLIKTNEGADDSTTKNERKTGFCQAALGAGFLVIILLVFQIEIGYSLWKQLRKKLPIEAREVSSQANAQVAEIVSEEELASL